MPYINFKCGSMFFTTFQVNISYFTTFPHQFKLDYHLILVAICNTPGYLKTIAFTVYVQTSYQFKLINLPFIITFIVLFHRLNFTFTYQFLFNGVFLAFFTTKISKIFPVRHFGTCFTHLSILS